jgi:DNA-binding LytR/AlgR family response regulator
MINCIAVDDEPLALNLIEDDIRKVSFLKLVKKCRSVTEALKILNTEKIDLIFLDIEMPDITGIQFLKSMKNKPMVIFITAYDKYALEGFELDVLDYLLKPVPFDRFLKAVNKAYEYYNFVNVKTQSQENMGIYHDYIFVKSEHKIIKINTKDILYIEGLKDYIKIYAGGDKPIYTLQSLKYLEEILPPTQFIRIHRSFIISLSKIEYIGKSKVNIAGESIPISNFYRSRLFDIINNSDSSTLPVSDDEE